MQEKIPSGNPGDISSIIKGIARTVQSGMSVDTANSYPDSDAFIPGTADRPPSVDFRILARETVDGGLFKPHPKISDEHSELPADLHMPTQLLDMPYASGIMRALLGHNTPAPLIGAVRSGFIKANKIIMQPAVLGAYFDQRLASDVPLVAAGIIGKLDDLNVETFYMNGPNTPPDELSFKVEGVNRSVNDRMLFTTQERQAAVELSMTHPELVVAIAAYQGTILDYLADLEQELDTLSHRYGTGVGEDEMYKYENYMNEWRTNNFYEELLPALAIYMHNARAANPGAPDDKLLSAELMHDAVNFILQNGSFKQFVTITDVPGTAEQEAITHTVRSICPAKNIIREHLADGHLLHRLYTFVSERSPDENDVAHAMVAEVRQKIEDTPPERYMLPPHLRAD